MNDSNLQILPFTQDDIPAAVELTVDAWSEALQSWDQDIARVVCEYSVRYEYQNPSLALKIVADGEMKGFIFASNGGGNPAADEWYSVARKNFTDEEQNEILDMVLSSSHGNEDMVVRKMGRGDAMLTFFLSAQKGCGSLLLPAMSNLLKSRGYENMLLWTDITCNHTYYPRHGFELVDEKRSDHRFVVGPFFVLISMFLYLRNWIHLSGLCRREWISTPCRLRMSPA